MRLSVPIKNAKNTPLNQLQGTVPNMVQALTNWFQSIVFGVVFKEIQNFQVVETVVNIQFLGVIQPLKTEDLMIKPEGQRSWKWYWVHSNTALNLKNDDVFNYLNKQYRVMGKKDYSIYGYYEYEIIEDYTGAGPQIAPDDWDGGSPDTQFVNSLDGGAPNTVFPQGIDGGVV